MRLTGTADSNFPQAFSTSNSDIGVVVEDSNGNILQPNVGTIPMDVDYDTQGGSVSITTYPVSTTGQRPSLGGFSGRATVVMEFR